MPKSSKKKLKSNKASKGGQSGDEGGTAGGDFQADENASTISNASTNMSYQDLEGLEDVASAGGGAKKLDDSIEKIDNMQEQIATCLDNLMEKGFKEREESLKLLKKLFSNKFLLDDVVNKQFTLTESLVRSLKKGKTSEQVLACEVLALSVLQFGSGVNSEVVVSGDGKKLLVELIDDEKVEPEVRAACVRVLGLAMFCANESNSTDSVSILDKFEAIFSNSYAKGDGTLRTFAPRVYDLHTAALSTWCLLLCSMPLHFVNKLAQKHIAHFQDFLKSPDVDLRITAGETIAFLYELAQCDSNSDLSCFEDESLIETLKSLANDPAKYRSKKDKKQQRSSFRDILKTIDQGDFDSQVVRFGTESLHLDNWVRRKQYETFRELVGSGMNTHLQENEFIRDIFELGPAVNRESSKKANASGMSKMEKTQFNKEQFRNRTKFMNKKRENKDATATTADDLDD